METTCWQPDRSRHIEGLGQLIVNLRHHRLSYPSHATYGPSSDLHVLPMKRHEEQSHLCRELLKLTNYFPPITLQPISLFQHKNPTQQLMGRQI